MPQTPYREAGRRYGFFPLLDAVVSKRVHHLAPCAPQFGNDALFALGVAAAAAATVNSMRREHRDIFHFPLTS